MAAAGGGDGNAQGSLAAGAEYERLLLKGILIERTNERLCERVGGVQAFLSKSGVRRVRLCAGE